MARFSLVPRDREFFNLFDEAGGNIQRAADLFSRLMASWPDDSGLGREILICEQEGDRITHDIIHRLNTSTVTPFDREDIYELASALDDVVDYTEEAADFLALYHVEAPMEQAQELAAVLREACRTVAETLSRLRSFRDLHPYLVEINRLENEGDRVVREGLAALFGDGIDPMVVIRWRDIYERIEQAIDACETAANIIEGICVKQT
jgi:predicted phosphate transport protein (TIGR00153 family)